jgi:hypothetical protein
VTRALTKPDVAGSGDTKLVVATIPLQPDAPTRSRVVARAVRIFSRVYLDADLHPYVSRVPAAHGE